MTSTQSTTDNSLFSGKTDASEAFHLQQKVWQLEEQLSLALRSRDYAIARAADLNGVYRLSEQQKKDLEGLMGCRTDSDEPLTIYEIHYANTAHTPSFVVAENERQARAKVNRAFKDESDFALSEISVTGYYQFGNNAITV